MSYSDIHLGSSLESKSDACLLNEPSVFPIFQKFSIKTCKSSLELIHGWTRLRNLPTKCQFHFYIWITSFWHQDHVQDSSFSVVIELGKLLLTFWRAQKHPSQRRCKIFQQRIYFDHQSQTLYLNGRYWTACLAVLFMRDSGLFCSMVQLSVPHRSI